MKKNFLPIMVNLGSERHEKNLYFIYFFFLYIYSPDSQESNRGAKT